MASTSAERTARADELAAFLRGLADLELRDYCPLDDRIARALADDQPLLERIVGVAPREKLVGLLLFAAVRHLALADPSHPLTRCYDSGTGDPWPLFRRVLRERFDEVVELVTTRSIQTNEVGRASALLPALTLLARESERPLALVEVGASAGLNLMLDRFAYDYDGVAAGDPASPVQLSCALRGAARPPLPTGPLPIAARVGIDVAPIDVASDDARRWLEACVWPGVVPRATRLRAALDLARRSPPPVLCGDATRLLPTVLADQPRDAVTCIISTWVLAYLSVDARTRLAEVAAASARQPVAWITLEYAGVPPWLGPPPPPLHDEPGASNLLSLTRWHGGTAEPRTLAWVHSHGVWLHWLEGVT